MVHSASADDMVMIDGVPTRARQEDPMDWTRRFFGAAVASVGVLAFARVAFAKHQHLPAHQLLGNNINTDGKHEIHKRGDHTIYAHVKRSVTHKTKGEVLVKKYKTNKKVVQLGVPSFAAGETNTLVEPVSYQPRPSLHPSIISCVMLIKC